MYAHQVTQKKIHVYVYLAAIVNKYDFDSHKYTRSFSNILYKCFLCVAYKTGTLKIVLLLVKCHQ